MTEGEMTTIARPETYIMGGCFPLFDITKRYLKDDHDIPLDAEIVGFDSQGYTLRVVRRKGQTFTGDHGTRKLHICLAVAGVGIPGIGDYEYAGQFATPENKFVPVHFLYKYGE
jgi:hypothetical protein